MFITLHLSCCSRKREEDEAREAQKESKFGRHRRFAHGGHEEAGTRPTGQRHGAPRCDRAGWLGVLAVVVSGKACCLYSQPATAVSVALTAHDSVPFALSALGIPVTISFSWF